MTYIIRMRLHHTYTICKKYVAKLTPAANGIVAYISKTECVVDMC